MNPDQRQFGQRLADVTYVDRPSAYAVILRSPNEVAVVRTPRGCFLPGGGIEAGETPMHAVVRESLEECGLRVLVTRHLGDADQLIFTPGNAQGWRKRCTFFLAEIEAASSQRREADHALLWLARDDAIAHLAHESQQWAVTLATKSAVI